MIDYKNMNKVRVHNKNETFKHFIVKAICFKILFNKGYEVYTEKDFKNTETKENRVTDVYAIKRYRLKKEEIYLEIETTYSKLKERRFYDFYKDHVFYIIYTKDLSDDINVMENQIQNILGL